MKLLAGLRALIGHRDARKRNHVRSTHRRRFAPRVEGLEPRNLLAAVVDDFGLMVDSGAASDDYITNEATVTASVSWTSQTITGATLEFDHDSDGSPDGSESVGPMGGTVSYDPTSVDPALANFSGTVALSYRTITHDTNGDTTSSWTSFGFTLDRVAPTISSFTPGDGAVLSSDPTSIDIVFSEDIDANTLGSVVVEYQPTSAIYQASATLAGSDTARVTVATCLPGMHQTRVESVADIAGNVLATTDDVTWRITEAPTTSGIPDITGYLGSAATDVTLSDYFDDEYDASTELTYSIQGNTNTALFDSVSISGNNLTLDYADGSGGGAGITVRATDSDGLYRETVLSVSVSNNVPNILNFQAHEGPTMWTFDGTVDDENPVGMVITFGGLLAGSSVTIDAESGYFLFGIELTANGSVTAQTTDEFTLNSTVSGVSITQTS